MEIVTGETSKKVIERTSTWTSFYTIFSIILIVIVFIGFARSFFLFPFFRGFPPPMYLAVHGVAGTAWLGILLMQTVLVTRNRHAMHRKLGIVGAFAAAFLTVISIYAAINAGPHAVDVGRAGVEYLGSANHKGQMFADLSLIAPFPILVTFAICARSRPDVHKRMMIVASISLLPAAINRIVFPPVVAGHTQLILLLYPVIVLSLVLALPIHDYVTGRRIHPASWFAPAWAVWFIVSRGMAAFVVQALS